MMVDFNSEDEDFLEEKKEEITVSGARIAANNEKIEELSKEIKKTTNALRYLF